MSIFCYIQCLYLIIILTISPLEELRMSTLNRDIRWVSGGGASTHNTSNEPTKRRKSWNLSQKTLGTFLKKSTKPWFLLIYVVDTVYTLTYNNNERNLHTFFFRLTGTSPVQRDRSGIGEITQLFGVPFEQCGGYLEDHPRTDVSGL